MGGIMKCRDFKNIILIDIYGKLTPAQKNEMKTHIRECEKCAQLYDETEKYSGILEEKKEISLPDWEKNWRAISENVLSKRKLLPAFIPSGKFALAAAAFCLVFIIGLYAGKKLFSPQPEIVISEPELQYSYTSTIQNYAERLEILLINFINRGNQASSEEYSEIEKKVTADILLRTRLLKYLASQRKNSELQSLLEDMEMILVSISNLRPKDEDYADQLDDFIHKKALKFRLRQLIAENVTI